MALHTTWCTTYYSSTVTLKTVNFNSNHDDDEQKKRSLKKEHEDETQQLNNHKY